VDSSEFLALVNKARVAKPFWFQGEMDPAATSAQIANAEREIGAEFPDEYRYFLETFGGGYFGHANVFSVSPGSYWNIISANANRGALRNIVAVSDDQSGGYYGFMRQAGGLSKEVFYVYPPEGDEPQEKYPSLFTFLRHVALGGIRVD
jgi:hypothetical protein